MKFSNSLAHSYKSIYAKFTIIIMFMIGAYFAYSLISMPSVIDAEETVGVVVNVENTYSEKYTEGIPIIEFKIQDQKLIKLRFFNKPYPAINNQVPIIKETYDNGEILYSVDYEGWRLKGT